MNSVKLKSQSLKNQRFTPSRGKDIRIRFTLQGSLNDFNQISLRYRSHLFFKKSENVELIIRHENFFVVANLEEGYQAMLNVRFVLFIHFTNHYLSLILSI